MRKMLFSAVLAAAAFGSTAFATTEIMVTFEGTGPTGFAPLFVAFHDGSYDIFDSGSPASSDLETLAEVGSPMFLVDNAPAGVDVGHVGGGGVAPMVTRSGVFTVADGNNMFNYASMLLPTNDWFIGNGSARDISDLINGTESSVTINVSTVWDAGTESEDFLTSAGNGLFSDLPASVATEGDVQNGTVQMLSGTFDDGTPFSDFANIGTMFDVSTINFASGSEVAQITLTVVPEPASMMALGLGALGLFAKRPRRSKA